MAETKPEARAIWVVRFDMTSPQSIQRVVDTAKANNFNTLIVQVRGRGDAFYLNGLEPRSESLAGQPESFDPLQTAIDLGHKSGLQVHAWLNTFYVWSGASKPKDPKHVVNAHPEWLMADRVGRVPLVAADNLEGAFLDPGNPDARRYVHDVFLDVAKRYNVDGIHFDYVRYPNRDMGFNDSDLAAFKGIVDPTLTAEQKETLSAMPQRDAYPLMFPARWDQWRRDNVTGVVRRVYQDVKAIKPNVAVSAALIPWSAYTTFEESDAYNTVTQDWFAWMRDGILDIAVPMTYHTDNGQWASWVKAAVANRHKTHVWAGIGDWLHDGKGDAEKVELARKLGAQGVSFFSFASLMNEDPDETVKDTSKLATLKALVFQEPAAVPDFRAPQPTATPPAVDIPKPSDVAQPRW
ncbi:MAG TPA: family 10 glycosylhydrolase [Armatimonadota bacterium]|jgi:uncharacterized lipoprotein YddW (UPF0748 family)